MAVIELHRPRAAILKVAGINCDYETQYAFEKAGAKAEIIHLNQLRTGEKEMGDYQIIVLPGGFSYGDDIASGRVWAIELQTRFADQFLEQVKHRGRLLVGICNGFQVLVQTGLLPFGELTPLDQAKASLAPNTSRRFESRWIYLRSEEKGEILTLPVAHGEGRLMTTTDNLIRIESEGLVTFRYCSISGVPTRAYPENPNGSQNAIAGITDPSGRILGLMPHPERFVDRFQHPNWRRLPADFVPGGLGVIRNIVHYAEQL